MNLIEKNINSHSCVCIMAAHFTAEHALYMQELSAHYCPLGYDVHLFVDHLSPEKASFLSNQHNLSIVTATVEECVEKNYKYCILAEPAKTGKGPVNVWDKALFILAHSHSYTNYWFLEDDALLTTIESLSEIDNFYSTPVDLLINTITSATKIKKNERVHLPYLWEGFARNPFILNNEGKSIRHDTPGFQKSCQLLRDASWESLAEMQPLKGIDRGEFCMNWPLSHSITSVVRFSATLLECIKKSVKDHDRLLFQEYLFGTLALHYNLKVKTSFFLGAISHAAGDKMEQIQDLLDGNKGLMEFVKQNANNLSLIYHPFKGLENHRHFRSLMSDAVDRGNVKIDRKYTTDRDPLVHINAAGFEKEQLPLLSYKPRQKNV